MQQRALASSLTGLSMALGVALMILVIVIHEVTVDQFNRDAQGYHLIVGGVSNWAAYALAAALAYLSPSDREAAAKVLTAENCDRVLKAIVDDGPAVDAIIGAQQYTIDGLAPETHNAMLGRICDWLANASPAQKPQ